MEPVDAPRPASAATGIEAHILRVAGARDPFGYDLYEGLWQWPLWTMLGWSDIRQRYRRSTIGPFWITLSMSIFIIVLGVIYSRLFHMDISTFLPYFAVGYIIWNFISTTAIDCCNAFQEGERTIKQIKRPFSIYILRVVWRNCVIFLHTIVILVPLFIIFKVSIDFSILYAIPGLTLLLANQIWIGLILAILNSRFHDVLQIVTTGTQIFLFATPIMYPVSALGDAAIVAYVNPAFHFIEVVRAPLLGTPPMLLSWVVTICTAFLGFAIALLLFRRVSRQIIYWL